MVVTVVTTSLALYGLVGVPSSRRVIQASNEQDGPCLMLFSLAGCLFGLLCDLEDGGSTFPRNVGKLHILYFLERSTSFDTIMATCICDFYVTAT
jgi:hypothetical protein